MNRIDSKKHEQNSHTPNGTAGRKPPFDPVEHGGVTPPAPPAPTEGRDQASGRFLPGNRAACGNGHARRQAQLRAVLADEVGEDGLRRIVRRLARDAEHGDVAAATLILNYLLGKPAKAVDPDELDLHEYHLLSRRPALHQIREAVLKVRPDVAAAFAAPCGPQSVEKLLEALITSIKEEMQQQERIDTMLGIDGDDDLDEEEDEEAGG
jgi:hypothetical protein